MPALSPPPLAQARDPLRAALDALRLRGWVHAGLRPLDGVLLDRRGAGDGGADDDWRVRLRPWLEHAAELRAGDGLVLVLFSTPRLRDCAALGPCLPVLRRAGILTAAPFLDPEPKAAAFLRDHLVHVRGGRLRAVPPATLAPVDVAGWWAIEGVEPVAAEPVPVLRPPAPPRRIASAPALAPAAEPFAAMRADLRRRPRRRLRHRFDDARVAMARLGRRLAWLFWAWLIATFVAGFMAAMLKDATHAPDSDAMSVLPWIVGVLVAIGVLSLGTGSASRPVPSAPGGSSGGAAGPARSPLWRRAAAWLAWRSPYAAHLRRLYARRLAEVERLFAAGRTEEALRKAIGFSGGDPGVPDAFADLPLTGPGLRERLELTFAPRRAGRLALQPEAQARLQALYRRQASELARAGEVERAAFVLAELVGDPRAAVSLLVEAGRLATAARLAEARRLGAALFVPLWFRAGERERALRLAARHDAFAELWKELRPADPATAEFRDALAQAWAGRLAAAGALDRAAQIARGVGALIGRRQAWIGLALAAADPPRPESLARALLALPWRADEADPLHGAFAALLAEPGAAGAARRLALAGHLLDPAFEGGPPAPPTPAFALLSHGLARRLVADEGAHGHDPERARRMGLLAEVGRLGPLRQHLRRLARPPAVTGAPPRPIEVEDGPALAAIADAALLSDERLLVGYRSGLVRLLTRRGREIWRGQVNGLLGFATLGRGERALVLRATLDGPTLLLFDPDARRPGSRLLPRGPLMPLRTWHPHADETGWLVFDGEALTMLDTASLLASGAGESEGGAALAHHWRLPITEPGRALALADFGATQVLVHARADRLVEWWSVERRTLAVDCRFWTPPPAEPDAVLGLGPDLAWCPEARDPDGRDGGTVLRGRPHVFMPADRATERRRLAELAAEPWVALPRLAPMQGSRFWAARRTKEGIFWRCGPEAPRGEGAAGSMAWRGSGSLYTRFSRAGPTAAVFDDRGRLVVLDVATGHGVSHLA